MLQMMWKRIFKLLLQSEKENSNSINVVVHSEKHYQLTHLLEFGHALRNGGRSKAIPHIAPAEQRGIENFEKRVMEGLDG